ncbi:MAG TPA: hypothetical protein VM639_24415 [Dongiaceae bacterium]|nr:hypothetical protein [Dongiaceae bacterium]
MSYLEEKTRAYWQASSELAQPIVELTAHRQHKEKLWRLVDIGPSFRLRQNSRHALALRGETIRFSPAPNDGDAA